MRLQILTGTLLLAAVPFAHSERVYIHDQAGRLVEIKEVDLQNDPQNCGQVGNVCAANRVCQQGQCTACFPGSDIDCDGRPNSADNCPYKWNRDQLDTDGDTVGDVCDNCPSVPNRDQLNTDGAGDGGDACDDDDDNDTCFDWADDKPKEDSSITGWRVAANCQQSMQPIYTWDGYDWDRDGGPNCNDKDDDGDGVKDVNDACPIHWGNDPMLCQGNPVSCPYTEYLNVCQFGGCNLFLIKIVSVIYPPMLIETFTLRSQLIYIFPSWLTTLQQVEGALRDQREESAGFRMPAKGTPRGPGGGPVRIEIWSKDQDGRPDQLVAEVAQYDPGRVEVLEPAGEAVISLSVLEGGTALLVQRTVVPLPEENGLRSQIRTSPSM
jgi:hypothetical protein